MNQHDLAQHVKQPHIDSEPEIQPHLQHDDDDDASPQPQPRRRRTRRRRRRRKVDQLKVRKRFVGGVFLLALATFLSVKLHWLHSQFVLLVTLLMGVPALFIIISALRDWKCEDVFGTKPIWDSIRRRRIKKLVKKVMRRNQRFQFDPSYNTVDEESIPADQIAELKENIDEKV